MLNLWGEEVIEIVEEKDKAPSLFDCIRAIQNKTGVTGDLVALYEPYVINDMLGQNENIAQIANLMNTLNCIPKEHQFKFMYEILPKGLFISKKMKKSVDKHDADLLSLGYTEKQIQELTYVLSSKEIKRIINGR